MVPLTAKTSCRISLLKASIAVCCWRSWALRLLTSALSADTCWESARMRSLSVSDACRLPGLTEG